MQTFYKLCSKNTKAWAEALLKILLLQGDTIRQYISDIPRTEPKPMIHAYVDLHLMSLFKAGILEPPSGELTAQSQAVSLLQIWSGDCREMSMQTCRLSYYLRMSLLLSFGLS